MTTVVTAFYPIKSKFPPEQYLQWAQRFLQLAAPIVLFTEPHLVDTFQSMRSSKPLHILAKPFKDLEMWQFYETNWRHQHAMDHEPYHTPELYALWAQKSVFVAEAIRIDPFNTNTFYWCDIGAFRDPNIPPQILATFPKPDILRMIHPAILLNSVAPLAPNERTNRESDFQRVNRIVGGLWGGTKTACMRWRSAFEAQLLQYFAANRFAGKDQSVMLSAYLENTFLAAIARPTTKAGDHWFFQQYLLTDLAPFEQDYSYFIPTLKPAVTVKLMGGLGNQMFQIATAWAYAKTHKGMLQLSAEKEQADGRPMYWSSVFHRFQHFLHPSPAKKSVHWEPAPTEYAPLSTIKDGIQLQGYFQSSRYFNQYATELKALFRPDTTTLAEVKERHGELLEMRDRIVVVHARRGDYLKAADHHGPLTVDYYNRAFTAMAAKIKDPVYLLVADEPMWFLEVLSEMPALQTAPFILLTEEDEVVAFALLQQFKYFILANSTYSWWFAWMADAVHVVAPLQWFGPTGPKKWEDIYESAWERV